VACRRILGLALGRATALPIGVFAVAYLAGRGAGDVVAASTGGWMAPTVAAALVAVTVSLGLAAAVAWQPFRTLWHAARRPAPSEPAPSEPAMPVGAPA